MKMTWNGVMPAITTPFTVDGEVDHDFLARHALWMIEAGCTGIVALGSLGEAATLSVPEKLQRAAHAAPGPLDGRVPLVAGIAALSTDEACGLARERRGRSAARGLMVLPPYVYSTDWREMRAHVSRGDRGHRRCRACSTTTRSPTAPTSCPSTIAELAADARQSGGGQGVERRHPPHRRDPRAAGRPAGHPRGRGRRDRRGHRRRAPPAGSPGLVNALPHESVRLFDWRRAQRDASAPRRRRRARSRRALPLVPAAADAWTPCPSSCS